MENEQKEDDFLGDLKDDAQGDPFAPSNEDPFAQVEEKENQTEKVETDVKEEEKPLPFHKDPKIQRFIEKEIAKRIPEHQPQEKTQESIDRFEQYATQIFGNDSPEKIAQAKQFKDILRGISEETYQKALEYNESKHQEELAIEQEYDNKVAEGFENIEEETGVDLYSPENKKMRIRFIEFLEKVSPKENGEISELADIGETFKLFRSAYRPQSQAPRSKELASQSMERSGSDIIQKDTSRVTWDNVGDKIMERLGM